MPPKSWYAMWLYVRDGRGFDSRRLHSIKQRASQQLRGVCPCQRTGG